MVCRVQRTRLPLSCRGLVSERSSISPHPPPPFSPTAVACPANAQGASVVDGCTPDIGYHGTVAASTTSPFYATDGSVGASVAQCTSQGAACTTDDVACATKAGHTTVMACATPATGYYLDLGIATACSTQPNCATHSAACATTAGATTLLACTAPAGGFWVNQQVAETCTTQVGCATEDTSQCTTGADVSMYKCTTPLAGYQTDADGALAGAWGRKGGGAGEPEHDTSLRRGSRG